MSVSSFAGFLKVKSGFDGFRAVEQHIGNRESWSKGYYPRERTPVRLRNIYKSAEQRRSSDQLTLDLFAPLGRQVTKCTCLSIAGRKRNR